LQTNSNSKGDKNEGTEERGVAGSVGNPAVVLFIVKFGLVGKDRVSPLELFINLFKKKLKYKNENQLVS